MDRSRPEKCVVIREGLVAITGDFAQAIMLNQFIYWSRRVKDVKQFVQEERAAAGLGTAAGSQYGWIYKAATELGEELLLGVSTKTVRRLLDCLIRRGWLSVRNNPNLTWDRTRQYRVNLTWVQRELSALGYSLDGFPELVGEESGQNAPASGNSAPCNGQIVVLASGQIAPAIPEITPETTPEITPDNKQGKPEQPAPASGADSNINLSTYTEEFESFWAAYPKQLNKWGTFRSWKAALKRKRPQPVSADDLIAAAANYAVVNEGVAAQYLLSPANFLNPDCRYLSFIPAVYNGREPRHGLGYPFAMQSEDEIRRILAQQSPETMILTLNSAPDGLADKAFYFTKLELSRRGLDVLEVGCSFQLVRGPSAFSARSEAPECGSSVG